MKKPSPTAAPALVRPWRSLAWLSLAANLVLAGWVWRMAAHPPVPPSPAPVAVPAPSPKTPPRELASYAALGSFMAENNRIADLGWTEPQFAAFLDGFRASYEGRGLPLDDEARRLRDGISQRVQSMLAKERPSPIEDYFRSLREKEGVVRSASGLHYRITEPGTGPGPKPADTVVISYSASMPDGAKVPPLSRARVRIVVHDLLPGLAEGVQLLRVGGKALVYVPPELAFREEDWPAQLPKHIPLVFFVELHEIVPAGP